MGSFRDVVIVDGVRTPYVKSGADFAKVRAQELGRVALRELVERLELADGVGKKSPSESGRSLHRQRGQPGRCGEYCSRCFHDSGIQ